MMKGIQNTQLEELEKALQGNSDTQLHKALENYSAYMVGKKYAYTNLAYQATKTDTLKGKVIRHYLEALFQQAKRTLDTKLLHQCIRSLVEAHIKAAKNLDQEESLSLEVIQNYHFEVFQQKGRISKEMWASTIFLKPWGDQLWISNKELVNFYPSVITLDKWLNEYTDLMEFLKDIFYTDPLLKKAFLSSVSDELISFFYNLRYALSNSNELLKLQWEALLKDHGSPTFLEDLHANCLQLTKKTGGYPAECVLDELLMYDPYLHMHPFLRKNLQKREVTPILEDVAEGKEGYSSVKDLEIMEEIIPSTTLTESSLTLPLKTNFEGTSVLNNPSFFQLTNSYTTSPLPTTLEIGR